MVKEKELQRWFSRAKRVVVAGIGNPIRMDDAVGIKIVQALEGKVSGNVCLINCETVPESFTQQIVDFDPTHVLLIDAAIIGKKPGDFILVPPEELTVFPAVSTHELPLRIFCDFLARNTKAKVGLLLIAPGQADFGEGLTPEVEASARRIVDLLERVLSEI